MSEGNRRPIYKIRRDNLLYFYVNWKGVNGIKNWSLFSKESGVPQGKISQMVVNDSINIGDTYADKIEKGFNINFGVLDKYNPDHETKASEALYLKIADALEAFLDQEKIHISDANDIAKLIEIIADSVKTTNRVPKSLLSKIIKAHLGKS